MIEKPIEYQQKVINVIFLNIFPRFLKSTNVNYSNIFLKDFLKIFFQGYFFTGQGLTEFKTS